MEKDDRERMKHDMERINTAAAHMQELLNDLLELSRIGRMVNPSEEVSLGEIAFGIVRLLSVQIKERGIAVEIAPDIPPPRFRRPATNWRGLSEPHGKFRQIYGRPEGAPYRDRNERGGG